MNCPKCGAPPIRKQDDEWQCGSFLCDGGQFAMSHDCTRNQLAAMTAERDAARAERDTLKAACDEFMVWYDRDGSVGGLDILMWEWRQKVQPEFFADPATAEKGAEE